MKNMAVLLLLAITLAGCRGNGRWRGHEPYRYEERSNANAQLGILIGGIIALAGGDVHISTYRDREFP